MTKSQEHVLVESLAAALGDGRRAEPPASFPLDPNTASYPGLYSWWADDAARSTIAAQLGLAVPSLIYAGQAGATRWPSGTKSSATLKSRIRGNHIRGNASSSTFRLTRSCSTPWAWSWPSRGGFNRRTTGECRTGSWHTSGSSSSPTTIETRSAASRRRSLNSWIYPSTSRDEHRHHPGSCCGTYASALQLLPERAAPLSGHRRGKSAPDIGQLLEVVIDAGPNGDPGCPASDFAETGRNPVRATSPALGRSMQG